MSPRDIYLEFLGIEFAEGCDLSPEEAHSERLFFESQIGGLIPDADEDGETVVCATVQAINRKIGQIRNRRDSRGCDAALIFRLESLAEMIGCKMRSPVS